VEPLLRAVATSEIDTRVPLDEVVDALEIIADAVQRHSRLPDGTIRRLIR
jgi:hypothetical protein